MSRKKQKKKNIKYFLIFIFVCIIGIALLIFEINSFIKKSRSIKEQQTEAAETTNDEIKETEEIKFDSFLAEKVFKNEKEIESLSDKEIKNLAINGYSLVQLDYLEVLDSATSKTYVTEIVKNYIKSKSYNHFIDSCSIIEEKEMYYGVNVKWRYVDEQKEDHFSRNYIVPKAEYYNTKKNILNLDDLTKTKRILDIIEFVDGNNGAKILLQSFLNKEDDGLQYVTYYISSIYSESNNSQVYSLVKETKNIDKASGLIGETVTETIKDNIY